MEGTYCPGTQCARTHTSLSSPSTTFCGGGFFSPSAEVSRAGDTVHFGGHVPTSRDVFICVYLSLLGGGGELPPATREWRPGVLLNVLQHIGRPTAKRWKPK